MLIAVSKHLRSCRMFDWESDCEDLWITIEICDKQKSSNYLHICGVYIPPPVQKQLLEHFVINSSRVLDKQSGGDNIILGDFNLSSITWSKSKNCSLTANVSNSLLNNMVIDFMTLLNLSQYNSNLNIKGKILDLILCSITVSQVDTCTYPLSSIDPLHPPIQFSVELNCPNRLEARCNEKFLFNKADYDKIISDLNVIPWLDELSKCLTVDDMVAAFYHHLKIIIAKHVPKSKPRKFNHTPYGFQLHQ